METRGTALLAVLVLVAGALVWLDTSRPTKSGGPGAPSTGPRDEAGHATIRPLVQFDPADVTSVRLTRDGVIHGSERRGNEWQGLDRPDPVQDFLRNLIGFGVLADIPTAQADLKDYGLAAAHNVIELRLRGQSTPLIIVIGDRNPATTGVYVRLGEHGPVVLAGALVEWEFANTFKALPAIGSAGVS